LITSNTYKIIRHQKQVWVSHLKGVSILKSDSSGFINLTKANGLPIAEMNRNPFFQSVSGQMFLGGNGGWFTFHPDSIDFQTKLEAPTILKWRINYKAISQKDKLLIFGDSHSNNPKQATIYPEHKNISFELSTMNTLWGDQIKYAFKLVGYDDNWVEIDSKDRRITYTNLPVGNYIFQAKATNRFGVWSEQIRELAIEVRPSFTQTLGFKILLALSVISLIAGLAYTFQKQRYLKKIRQMESKHQIDLERQRISRDLHDNIGSQLTNIATKLEITAYQVGKNQSSKEIQERIEKVGDEARITIGLLRETIWAIQQDSFTLEEFAGKLQQHLERNISQPTIYNLKFEKSELNKTKELNANQALNLFRIFQEAIQNITKHAQATEVNVGLNFTESKLVLSIRDNGLGMNLESAKNKQNHYGLQNMQARAEEIGGEMRIESELGKGALIEIKLDTQFAE
jgi:signal transduction histidine kinase